MPRGPEAYASLLAETAAIREHSRARAAQACHELAKRIAASREIILESRELLEQAERLPTHGPRP